MGWKLPHFMGAVAMSMTEFLGGARNTLVTVHYKNHKKSHLETLIQKHAAGSVILLLLSYSH